MSTLDAAAREAIAAQHDLMKRAFETGDAGLIVNDYYTKDAWVFGEGDATWKGSEAILELYAGIVGKHRWSTETERLLAVGNGALEFLIGTTHAIDGGEQTPYKILFAWVKDEEKWLCATQMFASGDHF